MSDSNKTQPTPPPSPSSKTTGVPLKKETVRITLRARPGAGLTQPKELTSPIMPPSGTPISPMSGATSRVTPMSGATGRVTPLSGATSRVSISPANKSTSPIASKATSPIQLPSAPLPPPAARSSTTPVQLPPSPIAPPASRTTTYVKLDTPPAPAAAPPRPAGGPPPRPAIGGAAPAAPRPPGAPSAPRAPGAPAAPRPPGAAPMAPTVPLAKAPGAPRPPGGAPPMAPTVPLAKSPGAPRPPGAPGAPQAPKFEAGATTVPLSKVPAAPKPPGAGAPAGKAGPTQALPKATVQLAKGTQPMARPAAGAGAAAAAKRPSAQDEPLYEEKDPEAGLAPLAVVCTVLALALMSLSLLSSDRVFFANPGEESSFMVPAPNIQAWEQSNGDGTFVSTFNKTLKDLTSKYE